MSDRQIDEALETLEDLSDEAFGKEVASGCADITLWKYTIRQALERQREEIDALSRLNRALDEKLAALERQRQKKPAPTDKQLDGLARDIVMWMSFAPPHTAARLRDHLEHLGRDIPKWLQMKLGLWGDAVPPKSERALWVYQAIEDAAIAAAPEVNDE